ncbi:SGNH/GDSL hydrolase family protein [Candidatus Marithrix sp. Canyon 246]|uniref:SGNH/GDSL hydrolase family protein n=1 Tax=Candidatus Marithrix sp. Canyon 246 TaxID=1827136 RepID=UPI00084A18BE|nr:SGNH/GDSL hydrolase family protein [Candidatus Marithrix sp. Canyon 246]
MKKFFFSIILFLIVIVSTIVLSEITIRIFAPQAIVPRFVESAPWGIRKVIANVDAIHKTDEYHYRYRTNYQGFRATKEYSLNPEDGVYRIVVQGDSVTLGHGVKDNETFSAVLEDMLRKKGINAEVINIGVSGFGTAEELIQFENVAKKYNPNLIILAYFQNDDKNNHVSKLYEVKDAKLERKLETFQPGIYLRDRISAIPFYNFLSQNSHLLTFFRNYFSSYILRQLKEQIPENVKSKKSNEEASLLTQLLLNKYIENVTKSGTNLILLDIVDKRFQTDFPKKQLVLNEHTKIVETSSKFISAKENGIKLYYDVDSHPIAAGHKLIAKILTENILDIEK